MTLITKPDFTYVWASGGAVVAPNDAKKQLGWVAEAPPFQYDNWLQNRQDQMLAHINQRGIAAWDGLTNYEAGGLSYVQGSDGKVYKSVAASGPSSVVQNPTTDGTDTYWTVAFADVGAFLTQAAADARYMQLSLNGSDIPNTTTFRANIGVYSASQVDALIASASTLDTTRIDVASASTVNLATAAPNTRHINITGTTAITGFTVAAGQCYFVRFAGALTLTNGAGLVTQSGANIKTTAGDTCIIRATAANVVELLAYTPGIPQEIGYRQTWQDVKSSRVANTTYTNTASRPILVSVTQLAGNSQFGMAVDGLYIGEFTPNTYSTVVAIVPVGSTYLVGTGGTITYWAELR